VYCVLFAIGLVALLAGPAWAGPPRTYFTGMETVDGFSAGPVLIPAGSKFHFLATQLGVEIATDPRVSGDSFIGINAIWDLPAMTGPMWGSFRLVNADGEWNGHWQGSRTLTTPAGDVVSSIVAMCVGSGAYKGLVARWDIEGLNVGPANPYLYYKGFIVEATKGRVDLPMTWRGTRTETMDLDTLEFQIPWEAGQGTHVGRSANSGFGFLVPTSATEALVTGMGRLTAANGDLLYWVVSGVVDLTGQNGATVSVYFTAGSGRFDDVSGQANGTAFAPFGPPDADNVVSATYSYELSGTIRY
jgi:hypothetical protein